MLSNLFNVLALESRYRFCRRDTFIGLNTGETEPPVICFSSAHSAALCLLFVSLALALAAQRLGKKDQGEVVLSIEGELLLAPMFSTGLSGFDHTHTSSSRKISNEGVYLLAHSLFGSHVVPRFDSIMAAHNTM
jgi:hypothetical protein